MVGAKFQIHYNLSDISNTDGPPLGNVPNYFGEYANKFVFVSNETSSEWQNLNFELFKPNEFDDFDEFNEPIPKEGLYRIVDDHGYCLTVGYSDMWKRNGESMFVIGNNKQNCAGWRFYLNC